MHMAVVPVQAQAPLAVALQQLAKVQAQLGQANSQLGELKSQRDCWAEQQALWNEQRTILEKWVAAADLSKGWDRNGGNSKRELTAFMQGWRDVERWYAG